MEKPEGLSRNVADFRLEVINEFSQPIVDRMAQPIVDFIDQGVFDCMTSDIDQSKSETNRQEYKSLHGNIPIRRM